MKPLVNRHIGWRVPPILLLVTLLAFWRAGLALFLPYDRFISLFDDDAFYYFGVARNIAAGSGSTFNGLDLTNGYHPAWLMIIEPFFLAFQGRAALVGITFLSSMMFIVLGILLQRLCVLVDNTVDVAVASAPLIVLGAMGPSYFFSGMETGLVILTIVALGILFVQTEGLSPTSAGFRSAFSLGFLLAASVAARLDSVILVGIVILFTFSRWRASLRYAVVAAFIPLAFLLTYMLVNMRIFGTLSPISGQAKAAGSQTNFGVLKQFFLAPELFGVNLYLGLVAAPVSVIALVLALSKRGVFAQPLARFGAFVYLGAFSTVLYYGFSSSWSLWPWYFYGVPIALLFSGIVLVRSLRLTLSKSTGAVANAAVYLIVLCIILLAGVWTQGRLYSPSFGLRFVATGPHAAELIDQIAPIDAPVAVGDRAGSLGFHLHRPTIHLEGLVNSKEFLDALENQEVGQFLNSRGVRLYARVDAEPGESLTDSKGIRRFAEPLQGNGPKTVIYVSDGDLLLDLPIADGTSYRVWRYRSELNPG